MPVHLEHDLSGGLVVSRPEVLHVGLVNNMPDMALEATERQFLTLLNRAAGDLTVLVSFYALSDVIRPEPSRTNVHRRYLPLARLLDRKLDGLIVTGAEPREENLTRESYWGSLARVIDWAEHNTASAVWSCLAAHAAVLHLDGIQRRRMEVKRFGVFEFSKTSQHPLTASVPSVVHVPHSRWNDLKIEDLNDRGYEILTRSKHGVDAFVRQKQSLFLFFQGHPEYESNTLWLEYRRDVGRYLRGERDWYPPPPTGYLDPDTATAVRKLQDRCLSDRREQLLADLPTWRAGIDLSNTWLSVAAGIYANWLRYLHAEKERLLTDPLSSRSGVIDDAGLRRSSFNHRTPPSRRSAPR